MKFPQVDLSIFIPRRLIPEISSGSYPGIPSGTASEVLPGILQEITSKILATFQAIIPRIAPGISSQISSMIIQTFAPDIPIGLRQEIFSEIPPSNLLGKSLQKFLALSRDSSRDLKQMFSSDFCRNFSKHMKFPQVDLSRFLQELFRRFLQGFLQGFHQDFLQRFRLEFYKKLLQDFFSSRILPRIF